MVAGDVTLRHRSCTLNDRFVGILHVKIMAQYIQQSFSREKFSETG